jgi:hypothetical protein
MANYSPAMPGTLKYSIDNTANFSSPIDAHSIFLLSAYNKIALLLKSAFIYQAFCTIKVSFYFPVI